MARLAERLKKDGSNVNGWVELVRSYRVLGQNDKAEAAMADARRALENDPDKLRQFTQGTEAGRINRAGGTHGTGCTDCAGSRPTGTHRC